MSVPVSNQDQAREFYVDTLGFELLVDNSCREGMRWIEVSPKSSATSLILVSWSDALLSSMYRVIVVATEDILAFYEDLLAKGVFFELRPTKLRPSLTLYPWLSHHSTPRSTSLRLW